MATVLIIDDEEMIRSLAEKILERDSHIVFTAATSSEAIALFKENSDEIDLLIVDMVLDEMNGFEILSELRKIKSDIPGIISSGNSYNENDIPVDINQNIFFLQKPYRANNLTEMVNSLLTLS